MLLSDYQIPLTQENIVEIIHSGNATHSEVCEEWMRILNQKWNIDALACYCECMSQLTFDKVKQDKRFCKKETLIPKDLSNFINLTVYYRMEHAEDYPRSKAVYPGMADTFLLVLKEHNIDPHYMRVCTPEEMQYFGVSQYDRDWRSKWATKFEQLQIPANSQPRVEICFEPFESLAMWHIYADTRVSVEKYFHNRFFPRVGVKVYHDESTHYIIFDSKEFLDDFRADGKLRHDTMFEVLEMVKQKDVWHAIDICGYKTVLQTMDGLTPEQRWICMKR